VPAAESDPLSRGYESIHDPAELRTAVRELRRVRQTLEQFGDMAAEMPGWEPAHVPLVRQATMAVVSLLLRRAQAQLARLNARRPPPGVVVVDAERRQLAPRTIGGLVWLPMVTEPGVRTQGVSSAVLRLDSGQSSAPLLCPDTDTILIVLFGALDLTWWTSPQHAADAVIRRHQHAHIRRGTRHLVANSGAVPATAVVVRATADVTAGCEVTTTGIGADACRIPTAS